MTTHARIALVKSDAIKDWWTIEKAEHGHTDAFIPTGPNSASYWHSGRISDACVEGVTGEMQAIAKAVLAGERCEFKRCATLTVDDEVFFWSPRNSRTRGAVDVHEARRWARAALKQLKRSTT